MKFKILTWVCALTLLVAPALWGQTPSLIRNVTPPVWQADDVGWSRDTKPHNKIDDAIDNSTNQLFDVIVNFNHCPTDSDLKITTNNTQKGRIQLRSKYISSVLLAALSKPEIRNLAAYPGVAFIEAQSIYVPHLGISVPAICVTPGAPGSGSCSPNTVQEQFPNLNGTGINIAIIDTGVDNSGPQGHSAFAGIPFIGGYDATATPPVEIDPDDDIGHGTHVASIALGKGGGTVSRGVAPNSGLIDVKVFRQGFVTTDAVIFDALEHVYDRRSTWNANVINMSLGNGSNSDGKEAVCQLVNLAESMGIVVVISAGNDGPNNVGLGSPGAASRAITVAAGETHNTVMRSDDTIACFSNRGPRANDGDLDNFDEQKPEVAAPGTHLVNCQTLTDTGILGALFNSVNGSVRHSGTSMAAPHVAGVAALIMQAKPGINAASVKQLILDTASAPTGMKQAWQPDSGYGYINAYAAINTASAADMTYPSYPPPVSWESPDISISPDPARVGQMNIATVTIQNRGPNPANGVRVFFGVYVFSAATPTFQNIGTVLVPTIAAGVTMPVSINWIPANAGHQCLKVEIAYGADTDFSNNTAQRNLTVQMSPVQFMVQNTLTEQAATIDLIPTLGTNSGPTNWTFRLEPRQVVLAANDCPVPITAELFPGAGARPGERQTLRVAAVINTQLGRVLLGGVTIVAVKPLPPDIGLQPTNFQAPCGNSVTFTVGATGTEPLSYQWQLNGVDLPAANQPALTIYPVRPADAGAYRVRVTNSAGGVVSASATLSVLPGTSPSLKATLETTDVLVQWPVTCGDYDLQEASSLTPPIAWMPVATSVAVETNVNVVIVPLQRNGNRFFRLIQRMAGTIPLQPPDGLPGLIFNDTDPTPVGATGVTEVVWQPIPGSLTDALESEIRFAAQQSPLVRSLIGNRYAYIGTSPMELPKGATNAPGTLLQSQVTFFSHSFNWAVLVNMSGTNVLSATNSTTFQPPEGADEVAEALDLARLDARLAPNLQGLFGEGLLQIIDDPSQPGFGDRVISVTFSKPEEAAPRYAALVDLTRQQVLSIVTNP